MSHDPETVNDKDNCMTQEVSHESQTKKEVSHESQTKKEVSHESQSKKEAPHEDQYSSSHNMLSRDPKIPKTSLPKDCKEELEELEERENCRLEATGLCLINQNFCPPWIHTPFPPRPYLVDNQVSMIKDPKIYDQQNGQEIGLMEARSQ